MAVNEQIVTGRKFRKLIDETTKLWQRISIWTKSSDVEFDDGENAETKVGAIKGITKDLNTTEEGYAADMTALAKINSKIPHIECGIVHAKTSNTLHNYTVNFETPFSNVPSVAISIISTQYNTTPTAHVSQITKNSFRVSTYSTDSVAESCDVNWIATDGL